MSTDPYTLHTGKLEEVLPTLPENSWDSCVTDGPYGLRFMGKTWDSFDIEKNGKRRDSYPVGEKRAASGRVTTGFGNSIEAGKYNIDLESNRLFQSWFEDKARHIYRVLKPGGYFISFGSPRTFHRMVSGVEDAGFEIRDTIMWVFAEGFPKSHNLEGEFDGWGSALKPAFEPILVARKPIEGTIARTMAKYGTGAMNIDACRIDGAGSWKYGNQPDIRNNGFTPGIDRPGVHAHNVEGGSEGKWPANFIHDGSPEVLELFPFSKGQQGDLTGDEASKPGHANTYSKFSGRHKFRKRGDIGSAARFFYCPKTSRRDREEGMTGEEKPMLWSSGTNNPGSFQSPGTKKSALNNHPTVKPTMLMRYLVRLVTKKGGLVGDPFAGSGSTGKACMPEQMYFEGIDEEPHYTDISRQRIEYYRKKYWHLT